MKTRINLYLNESTGEAFKRYCKSHRMSYSDVMETLIYRFLISPQSSTSHSESNLTAVQSQIHEDAVHAFHEVYDTHRQAIIETAIRSSDSEIEDVSPQIPMPITTTSTQEVNHGAPRTRRLSKRSISR